MATHSKLARREAIEGYIFLLPWLLGFLIFTLGPLIAALYLGFTNYTGTGAPRWIGFDNYVAIFTRDTLFWKSLQVTLVFALMYLPLSLVIGFTVAMIMNQNIPGITFFRTLYYLPSVLSGVAVAILWGFVFHREYGVLNYMLAQIGIDRVPWLQSSTWVLPALVIMELWRVGGTIIIYLAGLQGIPTEYYEAAKVDGAGFWRQLWNITLPMMTPTIFFNLVLGLIGTLQIFTQAYILTKGGPNYSSYFYSLNIYFRTFRDLRIGYASALAWVLFVITVLLSSVIFSTSRRWVYYAGEREEIV